MNLPALEQVGKLLDPAVVRAAVAATQGALRDQPRQRRPDPGAAGGGRPPRSGAPDNAGAGRFDIDRPLLWLSPEDPWTWRHAFCGLALQGGVGSGKTATIGKMVAKAMLRGGAGGLILTFKQEEVDRWKGYLRETGRLDSLIEFGPHRPWRFNWFDKLAREHAHEGLFHTQNLVDVLVRLMDSLAMKDDGKGGGGDQDPYWIEQATYLLRHVINVIQAATGGCTLKQVRDFVGSLPKEPEEAGDPDWQERSSANQMLDLAVARSNAGMVPRMLADDLDDAGHWLLNDFVDLGKQGAKTRAVIESKLTTLTAPFLQGVMRELFCTTTNVVPELCFNGAVILMAMTVAEHNESGRAAQATMKYFFQRAALQRGDNWTGTPAFLFCDEAHKFLTREDQEFATVARSSGIATVMITQSIQNYVAVLGQHNRPVVDGMLGNLATKVGMNNSCPETNKWFAEIIGKTWQNKVSTNNGKSTQPWMPPFVPGSKQQGTTVQESNEYQVEPVEFTSLRNGSPECGDVADGIVTQAGRTFVHTGTNHLRCTFPRLDEES